MTTRPIKSEASLLEQYRVALQNVEDQPQIAEKMAELGYDTTKITEGKTLLTQARTAYDNNQTEHDETTAAYANFETQKENLSTLYRLHRKKAKVLYRNDAVTAQKLAITGSMPTSYIKWLETIKKFYTVATTDTAIQTKLATLAITAEQLADGTALIAQVEATRAHYLNEVGESQDATQIKDTALATIEHWMSDFYAVARIALEEHPQLLEALGKKTT